MNRAALIAGATLLALALLTPATWVAHATHAQDVKRAAADRAAWCAAHPEQEGGPEMCAPQREAARNAHAWCLHDWRELAPTECPMAE